MIQEMLRVAKLMSSQNAQGKSSGSSSTFHTLMSLFLSFVYVDIDNSLFKTLIITEF